uniref:Uncharacterized protein n=1 Tax=Avena sativa TaxID=4498 RepID=A0ACD5ULH5_AVESA
MCGAGWVVSLRKSPFVIVAGLFCEYVVIYIWSATRDSCIPSPLLCICKIPSPLTMTIERFFSEEILWRGELDLRPEEGHVLLSRMRDMDEMDQKYRCRTLLAIMDHPRPDVHPGEVVAILEVQFGVPCMKCCIQHNHSASCWSHNLGAKSTMMPFYSKISFKGSPTSVWYAYLLSDLVMKLEGKLVAVEPHEDRWCIDCFPLLKNPCDIQKKIKVEIPESLLPLWVVSSDSD